MKRVFATAAICWAIALPASAAEPVLGEKLSDNQSYTFQLRDAVKSVDPHKNTSAEGADVLRQLFEGLLNGGPTGAPIAGAATSFDLSDDRLTYTFHLRPDAKWSNGDPLTAGDFVYSWQRLADPATASEYAWFAELMHLENASAVIKGQKNPTELGVSAPDDLTLSVRLTTPTPYFPQMVTRAPTFPVNQKLIKTEGDGWTRPGKLVGNGAYTLTSHDLGVQISMDKNPNYRDAAHVVMAHITGLTITDGAAAQARYLARDLDRVQIMAGQYPRLKEQFRDQAIAMPYACTYAYLLNVGDKAPEALRDVRVRKALSYAMPRDIVVDQILQGGQRPAYTWTHWAIQGFKMPEIDYAHETQTERLAQAKALLAEAGYGPKHPLKLSLQYDISEDHKNIALAAQQSYKDIGIELTLTDLAWKTHSDRLQSGDFEMARYAWCADYNDASSFLNPLRSDGMIYGSYGNADFDALMAASKTAPDPNVQYTQAEAILAKDMPLVPIYHYAVADMIAPDIKGIPITNAMRDWYAKDLYRIQQ